MMHDISNSAINHKDVLSEHAGVPRGPIKGRIFLAGPGVEGGWQRRCLGWPGVRNAERAEETGGQGG
jgi:hypothetical protein